MAADLLSILRMCHARLFLHCGWLCRRIVPHWEPPGKARAQSAGPLSCGRQNVERADFVRERGMGAMGPLMGVVMQAVGAADGKVVSALLREAIQNLSE